MRAFIRSASFLFKHRPTNGSLFRLFFQCAPSPLGRRVHEMETLATPHKRFSPIAGFDDLHFQP